MNQEAFWAAVESFDADTLLRMPRTALSERFGTEFAPSAETTVDETGE